MIVLNLFMLIGFVWLGGVGVLSVDFWWGEFELLLGVVLGVGGCIGMEVDCGICVGGC